MKEDETVNEREEIDVTLLGYVPVFSIEEILKEFGKFTGDVSRKIPLAKFKNQIAFIENVIGYLKENDNKYSTKDLIVQKWWNNRFCNSLGSLAEDFIPYTTLFEMVERTAKLETLTTLDVIKNELVTEPEYEKRKKVQHARYQEQFKEVLEDSQEGVFDPLLDTSRRNINASLNDLAIHKNIPFICGDDLHKLTCCLWVECYRKKIELKAHVGYDKLKNNLENSR
ncbi:hypothetical protein HON01_00890, partial [Candidatus Woesearchaeota archaeon]|nr:hypothetical protein [Candidatus Woesearchaeota archaeon]